jgi:hypothetical protein
MKHTFESPYVCFQITIAAIQQPFFEHDLIRRIVFVVGGVSFPIEYSSFSTASIDKRANPNDAEVAKQFFVRPVLTVDLVNCRETFVVRGTLVALRNIYEPHWRSTLYIYCFQNISKNKICIML